MHFIIKAALAFTATSGGQPISPSATRLGQENRSAFGARVYSIDTSRTEVAWTVSHMGFSSIVGSFDATAGSLTIDPDDPAATKLDVTLELRKMAANTPTVAQGLRLADYFDGRQFPTARFFSVFVVPGLENTATVVGHLSINGQKKLTAIDVTFGDVGIDARARALVVGFEGCAIIKRSDFRLGTEASPVSDSVALKIDAACVTSLASEELRG